MQGDSELAGTAIETSVTGLVRLVMHKKGSLAGTPLKGLDFPLLATQSEWIVHGFSYANYLADLA